MAEADRWRSTSQLTADSLDGLMAASQCLAVGWLDVQHIRQLPVCSFLVLDACGNQRQRPALAPPSTDVALALASVTPPVLMLLLLLHHLPDMFIHPPVLLRCCLGLIKSQSLLASSR